MRIIHLDKKAGEVKLLVENVEDLWHLSKILSVGDVVSAESMRSVRIGKKEEKKHVFITLELEEVEFSQSVNRLRIRGKIISGSPEDFVQIGRYHTIDAEPQTKLVIKKEWRDWQINRLKEAEKETKRPRLRIIVLDEEKALTAIVRGYGIDYGPEIYNSARKREEGYEERSAQYYGNILAEIEKHPERCVIAGPGFAKENLREFIKKRNPELLKRLSFESCSYAERSGVIELFKSGIIEKIMGEERLEREMRLLEEFLVELNRDSGLAVYGINEVAAAAEMSAIKKLLVTDELLRTSKEAESITEKASQKKTELMIFSVESDAGIRLKGFGGIAAILKFKLK